MTQICTRCQNPFEVNARLYAVIAEPVPPQCIICRLLARRRGAGGHTPRRVEPLASPAPAWRRSSVRHPDELCAPIRDWIARHDGALPRTKDFKADTTLPSFDAVYRLFGGLLALFRSLEAAGDPDLVARYHACVVNKRQNDMRKAGLASAQARAQRRAQQKEQSVSTQ